MSLTRNASEKFRDFRETGPWTFLLDYYNALRYLQHYKTQSQACGKRVGLSINSVLHFRTRWPSCAQREWTHYFHFKHDSRILSPRTYAPLIGDNEKKKESKNKKKIKFGQIRVLSHAKKQGNWNETPWECHDRSQETNWRHCVTGSELAFFLDREGILKIDQSVKMPWHRLSMGVAGSYSLAPAPANTRL